MVRIALDLFDPGSVARNRFTPAGFGEAMEVVGSGNLFAVMEAMQIASGVPPERFTGIH